MPDPREIHELVRRAVDEVTDRDAVVEAVTRRVLGALAPPDTDGGACPDCHGDCAGDCADKVRSVVAAGAARISYGGGGSEVPSDLARRIDHTLLRPSATAEDVDRCCREACRYGFAAVCVHPVWVRRAAERVAESGVSVASVVGFPLGANTPEIKAAEARRALRDGAREIDMVLQVGALKAGDHRFVERDIRGVTEACREVGALTKVILETALLTDEEKVVGSRLARAAKADFVKTSTGFAPGGATVFDVALIRESVGPAMGIKAAGGIHDAATAGALLAAGATRIGASAGVAIVTGGRAVERH